MQINPKVKRQLRLQHWLFIILFLAVIGMLAWLSTRYVFEADWTSGKRNTLSEPTQALLATMQDPLTITAFVSEANRAGRAEFQRLSDQYRRFKNDIEIKFIDPNTEPGLVREKNITVDGELILEYQGRSENLQVINEQGITNAIQRLARQSERWLVFLEGHKERSLSSNSNFDYANLAGHLKAKGFNAHSVSLASNPSIPDNTSVLIIADPQTTLLPGEVSLIQSYVEKGGNLLWLLEPGSTKGLDSLTEQLGIDLIPGTVVDMNTQLLGISDPRFALVPDYPPHPVTNGFNTLSVFPAARAMEFIGTEEWDAETLLETLPRTWAETDESSEEMTLDPATDVAGPLVIGLALTRNIDPASEDTSAKEESDTDIARQDENQQRVIVVGDSDFLANAYIGQGGNLDLGMNMLNWLANDDSFIAIPTRTAADKQLELSQLQQAIIGFGFLMVIPGGLIGTGFYIWWKRRRS